MIDGSSPEAPQKELPQEEPQETESIQRPVTRSRDRTHGRTNNIAQWRQRRNPERSQEEQSKVDEAKRRIEERQAPLDERFSYTNSDGSPMTLLQIEGVISDAESEALQNSLVYELDAETMTEEQKREALLDQITLATRVITERANFDVGPVAEADKALQDQIAAQRYKEIEDLNNAFHGTQEPPVEHPSDNQ